MPLLYDFNMDTADDLAARLSGAGVGGAFGTQREGCRTPLLQERQLGRPTIEDMLIVGESIRIPRKRGLEIINHVRENCKEILWQVLGRYQPRR